MKKETNTSWREKIHEIIYGTHTPAGKLFDILLLVVILYSIIIVMLESVPAIDIKYHTFLNISEWVVTILFSIEYILRIICIKKPQHYIFSFFGVIDLLSTIPQYNTQSLLTCLRNVVTLYRRWPWQNTMLPLATA